MDEPSAILDEGEIETLFGVVRRLTAEGVGVIYISHRLDEIRRIGDRVTVLADGRTTATGLPADDADRRAGRRLMIGRRVEQLYPERPVGGERRAARRARRCGGCPRSAASTLQVRAGEVVGLGGLVGSGRTELLRLIYGLEMPDEGEVARRRQDAPARAPAPRDRGRASASRPRTASPKGCVLDWSLAKNVSLSDLRPLPPRRCSTSAPSGAEAASSCARSTPCPTTSTASCACSRAATSRRSSSPAGCCATAACCCSTSPRAASTSPTKAEIYRLITDLATAGLGVLVVSSELEELVGICTRVLVMREGEIVAEVDGATATERELLRHAVAPTDAPVLAEEVAVTTAQQAAGRLAALTAYAASSSRSTRSAIVVVAAVRHRRDPQARHVPDLGQRPQHAHPGERRRASSRSA